MNIENVLRRLHDSEINCSVSSLDGGWDAKLGDQVNGFLATASFRTLEESADFLDRKAKKHYPDSSYAIGNREYERRDGLQLNPYPC